MRAVRAVRVDEVRRGGDALHGMGAGRDHVLRGYEYIMREWPETARRLRERGITTVADTKTPVMVELTPHIEWLMGCPASDIIAARTIDLAPIEDGVFVGPTLWAYEQIFTDRAWVRAERLPRTRITVEGHPLQLDSWRSPTLAMGGVMIYPVKITGASEAKHLGTGSFILIRFR